MNEDSEKFKLWIKGCEMNKSEIFPLVGKDDNAVYKIVNWFEYKHNYYIEHPIVYAVWVYGEDIMFTTDLYLAFQVWENSQKKGINEQDNKGYCGR